MEDKKLAIAVRVKTAREMAGLSQSQAAKLLSMHRPTISEIEAGRRNISIEELSTFAKLYKVKFSWLACEDDEDADPLSGQLQLAARELQKLKTDDLDRVIDLLKIIRTSKEDSDGRP